MNSNIFDEHTDGNIMNEELSNILEQVLMCATPFPVPSSKENMATNVPEVDVNPDLILQQRKSFDLEQLCEDSMDSFTEFVEKDSPSNNSTRTIQNTNISNPSNISSVESSEYIVLNDFHCNQGNPCHQMEFPFLNIESHSTESIDAFETSDRELVNIDIHVVGSSADSNIEILEPDASVTEIHPDSTSGAIHDLNDIADACLRFENEAKLNADSTTTVFVETDGVRPKVKRRRRREKNPDPPQPTVLPPCDICNDKSSGYHYGANTCEACKGFYRRTLKKKEVDYKCKCTPDEKESWKRGPFKNGCPACRYEKCLAVGMSKNAIKIGRYTLNHKTRNIKKIKSIESIDSLITSMTEIDSDTSPKSIPCSDDASASSSAMTGVSEYSNESLSTSDDNSRQNSTSKHSSLTEIKEPALTLKEIDFIVKTLTEAHTTLIVDDRLKMSSETIKRNQDEYLEKYRLKGEVFGFLRNITHEEFKDFYNATGIDIDGRLERIYTAFKFFEEKIATIVAFAKEIPGFKQLSLDDQANLIKASRVETGIICSYKSTMQNLDMHKKMITLPWGSPLHLDELGKFFPMEHIQARHHYIKQLAELNLSVQEESLLRAIVILFTDRCKLEHPAVVDALQEKMVMCLQHLINIRPGGSGTLLYKIFNIITNIRELTENEMEFSRNLLIEWPMLNVNKYHLVREFLC